MQIDKKGTQKVRCICSRELANITCMHTTKQTDSSGVLLIFFCMSAIFTSVVMCIQFYVHQLLLLFIYLLFFIANMIMRKIVQQSIPYIPLFVHLFTRRNLFYLKNMFQYWTNKRNLKSFWKWGITRVCLVGFVQEKSRLSVELLLLLEELMVNMLGRVV